MSATDNDTDDEDDDNNSKKKGFYDVDDDYSEKVLIISIVVGSIHFLRRGKKNILKVEGKKKRLRHPHKPEWTFLNQYPSDVQL